MGSGSLNISRCDGSLSITTTALGADAQSAADAAPHTQPPQLTSTMRVDLLLLLLASAALLAGCTALDPVDCELDDAASLSRCIKQLLINARPQIAQLADPLRVDKYKSGKLEMSNIVVRGISGFSVERLSVTLPRDRQIAVHATISWPHLRGNLDAKARRCWWIACITAKAKPDVTVGSARGTLRTTLNVNVARNRRVTVTASGTRVSLDLTDIKVKPNLKGAVGLFARIFSNPTKYVTDKVNEW